MCPLHLCLHVPCTASSTIQIQYKILNTPESPWDWIAGNTCVPLRKKQPGRVPLSGVGDWGGSLRGHCRALGAGTKSLNNLRGEGWVGFEQLKPGVVLRHTRYRHTRMSCQRPFRTDGGDYHLSAYRCHAIRSTAMYDTECRVCHMVAWRSASDGRIMRNMCHSRVAH